MKKYSLVSLLVAIIFVGCTSVDGFFGSDLIPPSQQMFTKIDSGMKMKTYQVSMDSMMSLTGSLVGSLIDPLVGRTTVGTITNFTPYGFLATKGDTLFGKNPRVDSMVLSVSFNAAYGDTTQRVRLSVFEMKNHPLKLNASYYMNFDPTPYYDQNKPLSTFTTSSKQTDTVHLPLSFAQQLVEGRCNLVDKNPYRDDSIFHSLFSGLYFKSNDVTTGKGVIYGINLQNTRMDMFWHSDNGKKDSMTFWFDLPTSVVPDYAQQDISFVVARHDYSYADPARGGVDIPSIGNLKVPTKLVYIQGIGGLGARVVMDMDYIAKLKNDALAKGYRNIGIHRAEVRWYVPEKNVFYYDESFPRMVLYAWNGRLGEHIPDYSSYGESLTQGYVSPIGGYLSRSVGYYSQNITSFMQLLFTGAGTNPALNMLPAYEYGLIPLRTVVGGSASVERAPQIILTYTLLK
ncbi:MAG: DUF4270 family protein [Mucinivorans sp.]